MKLESLGENKIRIILSHQDLAERNLTVRDMLNPASIGGMFSDLLDKAEEELGFHAVGPLTLELLTSPKEGVSLIVTKVSGFSETDLDDVDDDDDDDDDTECTCGGLICGRKAENKDDNYIIYNYADFEYVIEVAHRLHHHDIASGSVHHYKGLYHLALPLAKLADHNPENLHAIMAEYGLRSNTTIHVLEEYGKPIFEMNAVRKISQTFCK